MTFIFVQDFSLALLEGDHDLSADQMVFALTNDAPNVATWKVYSDITNELATANGYTRGAEAITSQGLTDTAGTTKFTGTSPTITATGAVGPFRYIVLYNNTNAEKGIAGYGDRGASLSLIAGDTYTPAIDNSTGLFTLG